MDSFFDDGSITFCYLERRNTNGPTLVFIQYFYALDLIPVCYDGHHGAILLDIITFFTKWLLLRSNMMMFRCQSKEAIWDDISKNKLQWMACKQIDWWEGSKLNLEFFILLGGARIYRYEVDLVLRVDNSWGAWKLLSWSSIGKILPLNRDFTLVRWVMGLAH